MRLVPGSDRTIPIAGRTRICSFGRNAAIFSAGLFLLASAHAQPCRARTWQVAPDGAGDAPTIQAGIDSSADGDTVLVLPGRYVENIRLWGKQIVLTGSGAEVSIIDGSGSNERPTVEIRDGEGQGTIIEGFTITGGSGDFTDGTGGGGILVANSEPTIRGNTIRQNTADRTGEGFGGGIYCGGSVRPVKAPVIEGNEILDNVVGIDGAGVAVVGFMAPVIRDNVIARNVNTHEGDGGGIWLLLRRASATTTIIGNRIEANVALDHGGGIYVGEDGSGSDQDIVIEGNWIIGNRAVLVTNFPPGGGGIWIGDAKPVIRNNTIVGNETWSGSEGSGGGIGVTNFAAPVIERNIIALSVQGGGIRCSDSTAPVIRNNLVWQDAGGEEGVVCVGWVGRDGNLELDPLFCDPAGGNYSVSIHSPALTAPGGPIGAGAEAGCDLVPAIRTTWGRVKSMYGD